MTTQLLEYQDQQVKLEAFIARPQGDDRKPLVLIAHAWAGRTDFENNKAKKIAELGYVGFALDMFGKGVTGKTTEEKSALIKPFMENRELLKQRVTCSLNAAKSLPFVDINRIAIIGFCFGGLCALDLARSGANINGVVCFHGLLVPPPKTEKISAKILAMHGDIDPLAPAESVRAFQQEMTKAGADWQTHLYGNTYHAFTNPQANDTDLGLIYNKTAEKRSWISMINFLDEIFKE